MHAPTVIRHCQQPRKMHTPPSKAVKPMLQVGSTKADAGEPGTMMLGVKLQGAERWRAWGAVALFTLLTMMQDIGTFMPNYLNEKVRICPASQTIQQTLTGAIST